MLAAALHHRRAAELGEARIGHLAGLVEDALLGAGEAGLDQPDGAGPDGGEAEEGRARLGQGQGAVQQRAGNGEGNDLDRRRHLARRQKIEGRQRGQRDRLVQQIERIEAGLVDDQHALGARHQIGPAGEGRCHGEMIARHGLGHGARGLVLGHVVGLEAHGHDARLARRGQGGDIGGGQPTALLEGATLELDAMGEKGALRLGQGHLGEDHAWRRIAVIWARMETAISAGESAPMESPTGPFTRAISSGEKPARARRPWRAAWVFLLPSAPI